MIEEFDIIRILDMKDHPEYNGAEGKALFISPRGVCGTWRSNIGTGGIMLRPEVDKYEIIAKHNG